MHLDCFNCCNFPNVSWGIQSWSRLSPLSISAVLCEAAKPEVCNRMPFFFYFLFFNGSWMGHIIPQAASAPLTELWKKFFAEVLLCLPALVLWFAGDDSVFACHSVLSIFPFLLILRVLLEDNNVWLLFAITLLVWGLSQVHWHQDFFFFSPLK